MLLLGAHECCHIGAGAAIATEFTVGVKHWLATGLHVHESTVTASGAIYEVTERSTGLESGSNNPPFLRFSFQGRGRDPSTPCQFEPPHCYAARRRIESLHAIPAGRVPSCRPDTCRSRHRPRCARCTSEPW